jgi:cell division protein FtsB
MCQLISFLSFSFLFFFLFHFFFFFFFWDELAFKNEKIQQAVAKQKNRTGETVPSTNNRARISLPLDLTFLV